MLSVYSIVHKEIVTRLRFLQLRRFTFSRVRTSREDEQTEYTWEYVSRIKSNIPAEETQMLTEWKCNITKSVDAVEIQATLLQEAHKYLVLILQYRPPLNSWVVEFPGGLIDENESASETAIRELYEETGYKIEEEDIQSVSEPLCLEPSITNSCSILVSATIYSEKFNNNNPKPNLQDVEDIEVMLVPLISSSPHDACNTCTQTNLKPLSFVLDKVQKLRASNRSVIIDAKVYTYLSGK